MSDKSFRLDFFIAVGALVVSALSAATLAYQTHVIGNQYAATMWPYLNLNATFSPQSETIAIDNDGLGPALVRSAQLSVDGRPVAGWAGYAHALYADPKLHRYFRKGIVLSLSSVDASTTLRAGDSKTIFALHFPDMVPTADVTTHALAMDFCYCSLNDRCWTLHAAPGPGTIPRTTHVSECKSSAAISAVLPVPSRPPPIRKE